MTAKRSSALRELRRAFSESRLVLYLGAGVSVDSALLTWEHLVSAMYFAALSQDSGRIIKRAYKNYLLAISEWYLKKSSEPIEITARKIRAFYSANQADDFLTTLHATLYAAMLAPNSNPAPTGEIRALLRENETLQAVAKLCRHRTGGQRGVHSVVTYNYDNLLEMSLSRNALQKVLRQPHERLPSREPFQTLWRPEPVWDRRRLPIYHVHGFIPLNRKHEASSSAELVFTEEEFNLAANNAYSWSNIVQLQCMTDCVGLAIGLSMTDRNMRRLLDACRQTPLPPRIYALLPRNPSPQLTQDELGSIRDAASDHLARFTRAAGMKAERKELGQVEQIINAVHEEGERRREDVLGELGVKVISLRNFAEIAALLKRIPES